MVKKALKNFFGNFIYVFVPMGIFYLFLLLAIFAFGASALQSAGNMLQDLAKLIADTVSESEISISDFLAYAMQEIDWDGNFFVTVRQILDTDWIRRTVEGFFALLSDSSGSFSEQFAVSVADFASEIRTMIALAITWVVFGILLASYATRFVVRRRAARRGVKKWIVANTLIPVLQSVILAVALWLATLVSYYSVLVVFILAVGYGILTLVSSWVVHGRKVAFKEVVNGKNIVFELLSIVVILLIVVAAFFLVFLIDKLIAILVAVPLLIYALNVLSVNADSYVLELSEENEEAEKEGKEEKSEN